MADFRTVGRAGTICEATVRSPHTCGRYLSSPLFQVLNLVMRSTTKIKEGLLRWLSPAVETNQVNLAEAIHRVLADHEGIYTRCTEAGVSPTLFARLIAIKLDEMQD